METVVGVLFAVGSVALVLSGIVWLVGAGDRGTRLRAIGGALFIAATGLLGYAHFNPPSAEEIYEARFGPRTPGKLFGERFVSLGESNPYDLVLKQPSESFVTVFQHVAVDATTLGNWMRRSQDRFPSADIAITARMDLVDRYGAVSAHDVLTLRWPSAEWRKVQWDTIPTARLVALSDAVFVHPAIRKDLTEWCLKNVDLRWRDCRASASAAGASLE
jgi:hypothetical protein